MQVTATEFKLNMGKYLDLLRNEDIELTRYGKTVATVSKPSHPSVDAISGVLAGKVPEDIDRHSIREERLSRYEITD